MTELLWIAGGAAALWYLQSNEGTFEQVQPNAVLEPLSMNSPMVKSVPFAFNDDLLYGAYTQGSGQPPVEHYIIEPIERHLITTSESPEIVQGLYDQQLVDEERYWMTNSHPTMDQRHLH